MRAALALVLLCACDLQPPKREAPAAGSQVPAVAAPNDAPTAQLPAVAAPIDAPTAQLPADADAAAAVTQACTDVAVHIAEQVIASVADPAQKAALEQDRPKLVRRAAETCTRDNWSDAARACFLAATTKDTLEACGKQLAPP